MDTTEPTAARRPPFLATLLNYLAYVFLLAICAVALFLAWPVVVARLSGAPPQVPLAPTLAPAVRQQLQQLAPNTAVEQQQIAQPPAIVPEIATVAPVVPPAADAPHPSRYSPVDLGWAPVATPTTMLSQEQFDASQASEEQNQLNTAQSGLTPAQQLVRQHAAEQNAQGAP